jgi:hypothetical protein
VSPDIVRVVGALRSEAAEAIERLAAQAFMGVQPESRKEVVPHTEHREHDPHAGLDNAVASVTTAGAAPRNRKAGSALAPPGECEYCDRRRALDLARVQRHRAALREKGVEV